MKRRITRRSLLAAAGATCAGLALGSAATSAYIELNRPKHRQNVIVIVADAMRADKIGRIVNGAEITPNLNRFAADCAVFENAYAASTQTKFSVASILTGQYPQYHGVLVPSQTLPDIPTIPSAFLRMGYLVFGVTANPVIRREMDGPSGQVRWGYGYAFTKANEKLMGRERMGLYYYMRPRKEDMFYEDGKDALGVRDSGDLFAVHWNIVTRNSRIRRGAPYFAYMHDMRTHQPWLGARPVEGITGRFHKEGEPADVAWQKDRETLVRCFPGGEKENLAQEDRERIVAINDEAAATFDMRFGEFIERLKDEGIYEKATIVFTADHGDELWEHGKLGHSQNLFNASLTVPLMIKHPGIRPARVKAIVSNASIFATLMELFGQEGPAHTNVDSLTPYMTGEIPAGEDRVAILAALKPDEEKMILPGGVEVMRNGGRYTSYDVSTDPGELKPLAVSEEARRKFLASVSTARSMASMDKVRTPPTNIPALSFWVKINPDGTFQARDQNAQVPEEVERQLRSLGYLN